MVKEIAFSAYPAKDVARLRDFYSKALGLTFTGPFAEEGVLKYDEAKVGSGWFSVMTTDWAEVAPSGGVAFEVDDIDKTLGELRDYGVSTENVYDTPVCRISTFYDPEGNKVTLHQTTVAH
ncbi:MAG TPA: VOC family protein [Candidatus Baltobacteraceae bacterium]|jgi:predicted enzyme related to lactoylglutathione lyase|nr:VOC family protein [Candidatus Baltobacteraceae bacterium]